MAQQVAASPKGLAGQTIVLGETTYFIPPSPVSQFLFGGDTTSRDLLRSVGGSLAGGLVPFSVISTNKSRFDDTALHEVLEEYKSKDDVWSTSFLTGELSILKTIEGTDPASYDPKDYTSPTPVASGILQHPYSPHKSNWVSRSF